jgi:hypothetical protein
MSSIVLDLGVYLALERDFGEGGRVERLVQGYEGIHVGATYFISK